MVERTMERTDVHDEPLDYCFVIGIAVHVPSVRFHGGSDKKMMTKGCSPCSRWISMEDRDMPSEP
jgi:hypothetical protein